MQKVARNVILSLAKSRAATKWCVDIVNLISAGCATNRYMDTNTSTPSAVNVTGFYLKEWRQTTLWIMLLMML